MQENEMHIEKSKESATAHHSDTLEAEMSAEMLVDAVEITGPAVLTRKSRRKRVVTKSMTTVGSASPRDMPDMSGGEFQMSKEMEPSLERTKAATGLRKRRRRIQLESEPDSDESEISPAATPAPASARAHNSLELLMSEEMQPSLEKTKRRSFVARRGRKRRFVKHSVSREGRRGSRGAAEGEDSAGNLGMSAEMEPSLGEESGLPVRAAAAAGMLTPGRRIHYTDVEVGEGSSGSRSRNASEVMRKEKLCLGDLSSDSIQYEIFILLNSSTGEPHLPPEH